MKMLKSFFKKVFLGQRASSQDYIKYLRRRGVAVGEGVVIFRPFNTNIDVQNPHLLAIGDYVMMTGPVTILTHDYSWSVLKRKYGEVCGKQLKTVIGNNVFLGWGATVLPGAIIGDNVIVGAYSVCSGKLESDSIYAGNPARRIMSLEEFFAKRTEKQLDEATQYVLNYKNRWGKFPPMEELDEYFYLFWNSDYKGFEPFEKKLKLVDNYEKSMQVLVGKEKKFASYEDFLDYCDNSRNS